MEIVDRKFYEGFEGEPEIHFIYKAKEQVKRLTIWDGYFDEIMYQIEPVDGYWTSLAYYYHLDIGWCEGNGPWKVENPEEALDQFKTVDKTSLGSKTAEVLGEILHLFAEGIKNNAEIFIEED